MKRAPKHAHRCPTCGHRVGLSLTPSDVSTIRTMLASGAKQADVARAYGVTDSAIWRIKVGRTWGKAR